MLSHAVAVLPLALLCLVLQAVAPPPAAASFEKFGCDPPSRGARVAPRFGYDPGLERRCVEAAYRDRENFFADRSQCATGDDHRWVVANHSGPRCPIGPNGQRFPINEPGSPLRLDWMPELAPDGSERWAVRMTTDLETVEHPCWEEGPVWTWFSLQNRPSHGGEPLPRPDQLEQVIHLSAFESNATLDSKARIGVSAQLFWDGVSHLIEINLYQSEFWGDAHPAADVIVARPIFPDRERSGFEIGMNGRFMFPPLHLRSEESREIRIRWHEIIAELIERELLPMPEPGDARREDPWFETATAAVGVYSEIAKRNPAPDEGALADFVVRDFRVEARPPGRGPYVSTVATCDGSSDRLVLAGSGLGPRARVQLYNRFHVPLGEPIVPLEREGDTALLIGLDDRMRALEPAVLQVVEPDGGRGSNFTRTPALD